MPTPHDIHQALILEILHRLYVESLPRIITCLDQLSDEQIWWRPNTSSNSIGNLVLHLAGNVSQWIYTGLGSYPDHRDRQSEFDAKEGVSRDELKIILGDVMEKVKPVIENLPAKELLRVRSVQTFQESGLSILVHVTEHFSYHTGQIAYITKMLRDHPLGFYDGVTLQ